MAQNEIDDVSGVETTGHEWDGIKELNTPLPRWWLWTFYATIVFSIGYVIYYPAIPLIEGSTMGISGVTNRSIVEEELAAARAAQGERLTQVETLPLEEIVRNDELLRFAIAGGESLYKVNCSQCHGSGAEGGPGYPNLNDDAWLWGGDLEAIYTTIAHGVRNQEDDDARFSEMPAFGDGILERDQIRDVTEYILQFSGRAEDTAAVERGTELYADNCASCHGESGEGGRDFGAPKLSDALWLYGDQPAEIAAQIANPKHGVMPPWAGRLGESGVKQLTLYVHSLGGGEAAPPEE
ncbi:MAG: cytochrome-c oxidase, cbb3-type subunit III [Pseudomonadota bacterium]